MHYARKPSGPDRVRNRSTARSQGHQSSRAKEARRSVAQQARSLEEASMTNEALANWIGGITLLAIGLALVWELFQ